MSECDKLGGETAPEPSAPPAILVHIPPTNCSKMPRSPSHESVTTELSLFSLSSEASALHRLSVSRFSRGLSPTPCDKGGPRSIPCPSSSSPFGEDEADLIHDCGALASALGLPRSFSASDLWDPPRLPLRRVSSDVGWGRGLEVPLWRLDHASRSCSTWVAVGDVASTSQLPSPHAGDAPPPSFTPADFVRSVNKKLRFDYIRRRLAFGYKTFRQLGLARAESKGPPTARARRGDPKEILHAFRFTLDAPSRSVAGGASHLTAKDVERDRGKPLSKYERNMMIFNWLQTLDDVDGTDKDALAPS